VRSPGGAADGAAGGVADGVAGGAPDGVAGGVADGVAGGVPSGVPGAEAPGSESKALRAGEGGLWRGLCPLSMAVLPRGGPGGLPTGCSQDA
jgi:hypothetical protein